MSDQIEIFAPIGQGYQGCDDGLRDVALGFQLDGVLINKTVKDVLGGCAGREPLTHPCQLQIFGEASAFE